MKILYFGASSSGSTSRHRADALTRLGHDVQILDPYTAVQGERKFLKSLHYKTGYRLAQRAALKYVRESIQNSFSHDLIWVDSGELFGKSCLQHLRALNVPLVLYNIDDPTGPRDRLRFLTLKSSLQLYDTCVVVRKVTAEELTRSGCRHVLTVWRSYDEVRHHPLAPDEIGATLSSEVVFVGTWIRGENRDEILAYLLTSGVPISIWGDRWHKSPYWSILRKAWRGPSLSGRDYVSAVQGAKIALGFLSHRNRDLHTTRSVEIPFMGTLFLAERTSEHLELYVEGKHAMFWSTKHECLEKCEILLQDPDLVKEIASQGQLRVQHLALGNESMCARVLAEAAANFAERRG